MSIRVNLQTTINAERVRVDKVKENGEPVWYIRNHVWLKDGIVLNGGLYSTDENEKGYQSMEGRLFTNGHPKVDGQFVTIANQDNEKSNRALEDHYMYASNKNIRKEGGQYLKDIRIRVNLAKNTDGGKALIDWADKVSKGETPPCINTSTGLICSKKELTGNSSGKNYTWTATNQKYDHDALLINEVGAGGDDIALAVNGEEIECLTVNLDEAIAEKTTKETISIPNATDSEESKHGFLQKIANTLNVGVKFFRNESHNHEADDMNLNQAMKTLIDNKLLPEGFLVGNESDEEIVDKFKKKRRDQDKNGGASDRIEKDEDEDEDEELDDNKAKGKKVTNSLSAEQIQKMIDDGVNSRLATIATNSEKDQKETIVNKLVSTGAIKESERADYMSTPMSVLNKMSVPNQSYGINQAYNGESSHLTSNNSTSFTAMKMEGE